VDLVNLEQATADAKVRNWEFDLAISGHGGLLGDAMILEPHDQPEDGRSGQFRPLRRQPRTAGTAGCADDRNGRSETKSLVYQIQTLYADELPAISLYYPESMTAYNPKKGIKWYYTQGGIASGFPSHRTRCRLIQ
jgi:peptide/nickel transport system substrate-binding protein